MPPFALPTASTRPASLRVTRRSLSWTSVDGHPAVVDVEVDGHRIWSTRAPDPSKRGRCRLAWPRVLEPHLRGFGEVVVRDQATGSALALGTYTLGRPREVRTLVELASAGLTVDKWGKIVAAPSSRLHQALMGGLDRVLEDLRRAGYLASITGGTLLGAMREGAILERDDDADVFVYLGERSPADVSLESYAIERVLVGRGRDVIRHSDAHLQVLVGEPGAESAHVDVFLGFHRAGVYNQPIAVRGEFAEDRILPLGEATLDGRPFPAVADPEGWLELCYGPGWRVPDPTFRFHTPNPTRRRFENWFGVYDFNRHFWERAGRRKTREPWREDVRALVAASPDGERVLDLGCGRADLAVLLAARGRDVLAVDFAGSAIEAARETANGRFEVRRVNLADRRAVLGLAADELQAGRRADVLLSDVLAYLNRETRANVFLLLRALLADGGVAVASFPTNPSLRYDHHRPDTWHLPLGWLRSETQPYGLTYTLTGEEFRRTTAGRRHIATVELRRAPSPSRPEETLT